MKKLIKGISILLVVLLSLAVLASCKKDPEGSETDTATGEPSTPSESVTDKATEPSDSDSESGSDSATGGTPTDSDTSTTKPDNPKDPTGAVEIDSAQALIEAAKKIANNTDGYATKTFKLTADITLKDDFTPISGFKGTFDGQFHTISGLTVDAASANIGLFDKLEGATVKNLIIADADIANSTPDCSAGILAGSAKNSTISCVTVSGKLAAGGNKAVVGGLVGTLEASTVANVKAVVTVSGAGATVGGVVGTMLGKAMAVNAYSDATLTATAAVKGAVVGSKAADSAVAFALAKSGSIAGKAEGESFLPDYIIASKIGAKASDMGWNTVDWDVSGNEPSLKKDLDKKYTAPTVTLDGKAVKATYGEKLSEKVAAGVSGNVATLGAALGGAAYYEDLPVLNNMTLVKATVDFSKLAGEWTPVSSADAALKVAAKVSLGAKEYTSVIYATEKNLPVIYLKGSDNNYYKVSFETGVAGYPADAALVALRSLKDNTASYFMPDLGALAGAWTDGKNTTVIDAKLTEKDGKNTYRLLDKATGEITYAAPYAVVTANGLTTGINGLVATSANGKTTLTKDGKTYEADVAFFNGEWMNGSNVSVKVVDGKVGDAALTVVSNANGTGVTFKNAEGKTVVMIAGISDITVYTDGAKDTFAAKSFSGTFVSVSAGKLTTITISGSEVTVNGKTVSALVESVDGKVTLRFTADGKSYNLTQSGTVLTDSASSAVFFEESTVKAFFGTYVLGTKKFVFSDGKLLVDNDLSVLNLVLEDGKPVLKSGNVTFVIDGQTLVMNGFYSGVTKNKAERKLFKPAVANVFLGGFASEYVALGYNVKEITNRISMSGGVLKVNGKTTEYELYEKDNGTMGIKFNYDNTVISVEPNGAFAKVWGIGWGNLVSTEFENAVGKYYEFLIGENKEGAPAPKQIEFKTDGTIVIEGVSYAFDQYETTVFGGSVIAAVRTENGTAVITFKNKTAEVDGKVYINYDRILPAGYTYVIVGTSSEMTLEVIKGQMGSMEYDSEEDEDYWVDAIFPLYGFRYTVNGVAYTSESFKWSKSGSTATVEVVAADAKGNKKTFRITYTPDGNLDRVTVSVDGRSYTAYSDELMETVAGSYVSGKNSFSISKKGIFTLNGQKKNYTATLDFVSGKFSFVVDGKTYALDASRPEIAKCGSEVFYESSVAKFAGIRLVAYGTGNINAFQTQFVLELTPEGFKFNDKLVTWGNFRILWFKTTLNVNGTMTEVNWKSGNSYAFGLSFYPDVVFDPAVEGTEWTYRCFVPELLMDNTGLYAASIKAGKLTFVNILNPTSSSTSCTGFTFSIGSRKYDGGDYTCYMDGNTLVVEFDDDKYVLKLTKSASGTALTVNGAALGEFERPDISRFVVSKRFAFGGSNNNDIITIQPDGNGGYEWIYNPDGSTYSKEIHDNDSFSFGKWNGNDILYLEIKNGRNFVALILDDQVWIVDGYIFSFITDSEKDPEGRKVDFSLSVVNNELVLTGKAGDLALDNIVIDDSNYFNGDNRGFIRYKVNGKGYVIALNTDTATMEDHPVVILNEDEFNLCFNYTSLSSAKFGFMPVYDAKTGAGTIKLYVAARYASNTFEFKSYTKVNGYDNLYKIEYVSGSTAYTDYVFLFPDADYEKGILVLSSDKFALLGEHDCNGTKIKITVELYTQTVNDKTTVTPEYIATIGNEKYLASMAYSSAELSFDAGSTKYILSAKDSKVTVSTVNKDQYRYVGKPAGYSGAEVSFVDGVYKVKYKYKDATNVYFAADNSYLAFTADGVDYRMYWVTDEGSYKAAVIEAYKGSLLGTFGNGKLTGEFTRSSSWSEWSFTVKYNGKAVSALKFYSDTLASFEVGDAVHAIKISTAAGKTAVEVVENVLDLGSEANKIIKGVLGNYSSQKVVIDYKVEEKDGKLVASFYATYDGKDAEFEVETAKNILRITCGSTVKYYVRYSATALVEVKAEDYAKLGTSTVNGYELAVSITASSKTKYTLAYSVNDAKATTTDKTSLDGKLAYTQLKVGNDYYFLYVNGDTKYLQKLTADEIVSASISTSGKNMKIGNTYYYLYSDVSFDGTKFTVGYAFGTGKTSATAVTATALTLGDGITFKYDGNDYYYLVSGSSSYLVTAEDYAIYGDITANGYTLKLTWGTYQVMVSVNGGTAVKVEVKNDGKQNFWQFKYDGKTFILAKDSKGTWVLTDASNIGSNLKHFGNFQYNGSSKVLDLDGKTVFATVKATYLIGDDGVPSYVFMFGDKVATVYSEVAGGEAIKATIDGVERYFVVAPKYGKPNASNTGMYYTDEYNMIEVTAAQAEFLGKSYDLDGMVFSIYAKGSGWGTNEIYVYVGTVGNEYSNNAKNAKFNADGSLTFEYGGKTYKAVMADGKLAVTEA